VTITKDRHQFWQKLWQEAEPLVVHIVIVLLLEISLVLIGVLALALEHIFPKQEYYFSIFEKVDIWLSLGLLCLFGLYTLIRIAIRLTKGVLEESRGKRHK
jgi:hypothetical protein